jgi:hypothetical protein
MKAEEHLTLEDCLRVYFLPEGREAYRPHLDRCPPCAAMLLRVQREMRLDADRFRLETEAVPEYFWERQRHQIRLQTQPPLEKRTPIWRLFDLKVWATAAAILLFSAGLVEWTPQRMATTGPLARMSEMDKRDDSLLWDVYDAIAHDSVDPLRPLELLVEIPDVAGKIAADESPDNS